MCARVGCRRLGFWKRNCVYVCVCACDKSWFGCRINSPTAALPGWHHACQPTNCRMQTAMQVWHASVPSLCTVPALEKHRKKLMTYMYYIYYLYIKKISFFLWLTYRRHVCFFGKKKKKKEINVPFAWNVSSKANITLRGETPKRSVEKSWKLKCVGFKIVLRDF